MKCPVCHIDIATKHPILGILPCNKCLQKQRKLQGMSSFVEFTTEDIRQQRKAYWKDIMPMHRYGVLNKSWLERYGEKKAKQHGFSEKEINKAEYNWNEEGGYYKEHI